MIRKQLNVKLVVGLLVGAVVFVGSVHWLHGHQMAKNADSLKRRADQAKTDGLLEDAVRLRNRYLIYQRTDREQWGQLQQDVADHFEKAIKDGNITPELWARSLAFMEHVTQTWPDDTEFRLRAADFYFRVNRMKDALEHYTYGYRRLADEGGQLGPDETVRLAACKLALGETEVENRRGVDANADEVEMLNPSVEAMLIRLVGLDPDKKEFSREASSPQTIEAYDLLSQIYRSRRAPDPELADMVIDQMVTANPETANAYVIRAKYRQRYAEGKDVMDLVKADVNKAQELDPNSDTILLQQVEIAITERDYDGAEKLLKSGLERFPENPRVYTILSKLELTRGNLDEAEAYLDEGVRRLRKNVSLQIERANLYLMRKDFERFGRMFRRLQDQNVGREQLDLLSAKEAYLRDDPRKAMEIIEDIRPRLDGTSLVEANRVLDACYRALGMHDKRPDLLAGQNPNTVAARMTVIETKLAAGKLGEAAADLEVLVTGLEQIEDTPEDLLVRMRRTWLTTEIRLQNSRPTYERDWTKVNQLVEKVVADPTLSDVNRDAIRLQVLMDQGNEAAAMELATKAQQQHPKEAAFWIARLRLAKSIIEKNAVLDEMRNVMGDTLHYRLIKADHITETSRSIAELGALVENLDAFTPEERDRLIKRVGQSYFELGAMNEARLLWERQAESRPNDAGLQLILFDLAKIAEDEALMLKRLEALARITGFTSDEYRIARATYLSWKLKFEPDSAEYLKEARDLVVAIKSNRRQWPTVYQLEAELNLIDGKIDEAIDSLRTAFDLEPGNSLIVRRLAGLLARNGRYDEAEELLSSASIKALESIDELEQVRILDAAGDTQGALRIAGKWINSKDVRELEMLGQLLIKNESFAEAQAVLRQAANISPEIPEPWTALVQLGIKRNDTTSVENVMQEAQLRLPAWQLPEFLGESHQMLGDLEEAEKAYQVALIANPTDSSVLLRYAGLSMERGDTARAIELLQRIVSGKSSDFDDKRKARRELAKLWAPIDSGVDFQQVILLFRTQAATVASDESSSSSSAELAQGAVDDLAGEDLLLFVNLCANRPEYNFRELAVETLEKRRARGRLTDGEQLLLASLYQKMNRWKNCQELMIELLANRSARENPQYMNLWVEWLIDRGEDRELNSWQQVIPSESSAGVRARTYLLVRGGKSADAASEFQRLLNMAGEPEEVKSRAISAARWMESLGEFDPLFYKAAEKTFSRVAATDTSVVPSMVRVMGKQLDAKKLGEAIEICRRMSASAPDQSAEAVVTALRPHRSNLQAVQREIGQVAQLLASLPQSPKVILQRAYFGEITGNLADQETYYRQYLSQSSVTELLAAIAKNNLAFLLASQGKATEAEKLINEASAMFGRSPEILDTMAAVKIAKRDYAAAIEDLKVAIEKGGPTPEKLFHMARAHSLSGDVTAAADFLRRSQEAGLKPYELNPIEQEELRKLQSELGVGGEAGAERDRT